MSRRWIESIFSLFQETSSYICTNKMKIKTDLFNLVEKPTLYLMNRLTFWQEPWQKTVKVGKKCRINRV